MLSDRYTEDEVRRLLGRGEGQLLEFKSLLDRSSGRVRSIERRRLRDLVAEYTAAFANADGGTIVLGVEDDGTPTGHRLPDEVIDGLGAVALDRLRPPVSVEVTRLVLDGNEVVLVDVAMSAEAVMVTGNGFPYRVGDSVIKEPQEVINDRKQSYRRVGFEQRLPSDASLDDLDGRLVDATFGDGARSLEDKLLRRGLVQPGRRLAVTNAALLLFSSAPVVRWHPRAGVRVFRVDGNERRHGRDRNVQQLARIEAPLVSIVPEAIDVVRSQVRRDERLVGVRFADRGEYPEFAWQEAIVNAVAHRDYAQTGQEIEVWLFTNRLEVRSPGGLLAPVTLETLRSGEPAHVSRNPLIVRALVESGLMREEGEGVPRMIAEMRDRFLPRPEFGFEGAMFTVTLSNTVDSERLGQVADTGPVVARLPALLDALSAQGTVTNADYRRLFDLTRYVAVRELRRLVDEGYLALIGEGRGARYEPGPKLPLQSR